VAEHRDQLCGIPFWRVLCTLHKNHGLLEHVSNERDDVETGESGSVAFVVLDESAAAVAHAKDLSTTHPLGGRTKPHLASGSLTTSSLIPSAGA
jgi:hypothetical protein